VTPQTPSADFRLTPLARKLVARIENEGAVPVYDFMSACLGDHEHGYYRTKLPLGRGGDFITAPEISQVFGELLGLWAASMWQSIGEPETVSLIELGPGHGTLAADALRAAKALPAFREALQLHLVETSPVLRAEQERTLARYAPRWYNTLDHVPSGPAIILANEFFDALPIRQLCWRSGKWRQRCVGYDANQGFHFVDGSAVELSASQSEALPIDPVEGDIAEFRPDTTTLLAEIARRGAAEPQAMLVIDYGTSALALGDTLQAVSGHRYADIFEAPGQHDLTAHVNFRTLSLEARTAGLQTFGPMPQGRFLLSLGLEARCNSLLRAASPEQRHTLMAGVQRLLDPSQMGELFKAMAITANLGQTPPPFGEQE